MNQLLLDGSKFSWLAYSDPKVLQQQYAAHGNAAPFDILRKVPEIPQFYDCKACDANCYLLKYQAPAVNNLAEKPVLVIAMRGTSSLMDWLCDAEVDQVVFKDSNQKPGGKVHAGFYRQFQGLLPFFRQTVTAHLQAGGHLFCVGHSLGSATSVIAAQYFGLSYPGQVWYAGYGTPRAGDSTFATAFAKAVQGRWRIKHGSDPVNAIIPPLDYTHVGQEDHFGAVDHFPDIPILVHIPDHDIKRYVQCLS